MFLNTEVHFEFRQAESVSAEETAMTTATGHRWIDVETSVVLDSWYPVDAEPKRACLAEKAGLVRGESFDITIDPETGPVDVSDAYLRLHLLSRRDVAPHGITLDGVFGALTNVAWTTAGPVLPGKVDALKAALSEHGEHVGVNGLDKFPRMLDYVVPSGVRIANANRVRLGAHLAEGTTVMHEGFVNFNAGTLGSSMVEGRISAGVVVGDGSDVGGGASIMGTLSGGGQEVISLGERCLLGANSGLGISLGDDCIVEAGLYVTAGTKVALPDGEVRAGRELNGVSGLLFRRNSLSGAVEAVPNGASWNGLNEALHHN